jgi:hypothetical protein
LHLRFETKILFNAKHTKALETAAKSDDDTMCTALQNQVDQHKEMLGTVLDANAKFKAMAEEAERCRLAAIAAKKAALDTGGQTELSEARKTEQLAKAEAARQLLKKAEEDERKAAAAAKEAKEAKEAAERKAAEDAAAAKAKADSMGEDDNAGGGGDGGDDGGDAAPLEPLEPVESAKPLPKGTSAKYNWKDPELTAHQKIEFSCAIEYVVGDSLELLADPVFRRSHPVRTAVFAFYALTSSFATGRCHMW